MIRSTGVTLGVAEVRILKRIAELIFAPPGRLWTLARIAVSESRYIGSSDPIKT